MKEILNILTGITDLRQILLDSILLFELDNLIRSRNKLKNYILNNEINSKNYVKWSCLQDYNLLIIKYCREVELNEDC